MRAIFEMVAEIISADNSSANWLYYQTEMGGLEIRNSWNTLHGTPIYADDDDSTVLQEGDDDTDLILQQGVVTPEGEFGTQISEEQGDNMGANTGGVSQWSPSSYGVGALLSDVDWANITANATIGYDAVTQQLMIIWDASSAGSGNAFVYSFRTANWYKMTDATAQSVNMTNFANGRNNIVYVGGGSGSSNTSKLADRTSATTVDVISSDMFMENVESSKNLTRVSVTYKGGSGTSVALGVATDSSESFTTIGTLDSTSTSYSTETFSLTSDSNFKTKKSFQIRLNGAAASTFEIQDVSLVYRNLGVRV